ncbi:type II secretion system protein N [Pseudoduganella violaceinigra]|uniref:type II secretion system protein N n=1 Tax=Pseudoduganella violaceinigra TaxID=246602 RepID=UPI00040B82E0|nr:type II secretion system protein N [Pseudoduganella violaceinigra]
MKRAALWLLAIALSAGLTVLACLPASWMGVLVESQSGGRFALGDAQGTLWRGSAFIGGAASKDGAVTPLLPGRFSWRLSPLVVFGSVDVELANPDALTQPVSLRGGWSSWEVSPAALMLPADGLAGLGAPLNTLAPSGRMKLSWTSLQLERAGPAVSLQGRTTLEMQDMSSSLTSLKPLGSYQLAFDWKGQQAALALDSQRGPLLLSGTGKFEHGRLQFSGQAQAAKGFEEQLASLLNMLGQPKPNSGKNVIALEFR